MKIAVLGTGMVGRAIAERLLSLGHQVAMGTRDPEKTKNFKKDNFSFQNWLAANRVKLTNFADAAAHSEMLVINCTAGMVSLEAFFWLAYGTDHRPGRYHRCQGYGTTPAHMVKTLDGKGDADVQLRDRHGLRLADARVISRGDAMGFVFEGEYC